MYPLASSTWDDEEITIATELLKSGELTMGKKLRSLRNYSQSTLELNMQ